MFCNRTNSCSGTGLTCIVVLNLYCYDKFTAADVKKINNLNFKEKETDAESETDEASYSETDDAEESETDDSMEGETDDAVEGETDDAMEGETGNAREFEAETITQNTNVLDEVLQLP